MRRAHVPGQRQSAGNAALAHVRHSGMQVTIPMNNSEFQAQTEHINRQVQRVSEIQNEDARAAALDLLQSVMDLHGAVISRVVEVLSGSGDAGRNSLAKLGSDPLICGLLVLYGVHPLPLEERVGRAVE